MAITRRSALILLATVVAGAGIIGASGAFSSVTADRTITVSSTSDSSANVQITVNEVQGLSDTSADTVGLNVENLNKNASTTFDDALTITPQGANGPYDISISNVPTNVEVTVNGGTDVSGGTSVNADITVNLRGDKTVNDIPSNGNLTISVTQASS